MPLLPVIKDLGRDLGTLTVANRGSAGLSVGVFLMTLLYAARAYSQDAPPIGALPADAGTLEPWVLIVAVGLNSIGLLASALKSWAAARQKNTEMLEGRVDSLETKLLDAERARAVAEGRLEALSDK